MYDGENKIIDAQEVAKIEEEAELNERLMEAILKIKRTQEYLAQPENKTLLYDLLGTIKAERIYPSNDYQNEKR